MAQRREAKVASIVASAWELAQDNGVAGISLHSLARELGIRQPSLYAYFDSKNALYDAMFADGNRQLVERLDELKLPRDPRAALKKFMRTFVAFALEDPARASLMFQRPIPGFAPSAESYAIAEEALRRAYETIHAAGVTNDGDIDCVVALVGGLMDAQLSNDPRGDRWIRHLDRLIDLYVNDVTRRSKRR